MHAAGPKAIDAGAAELVGVVPETIAARVSELLADESELERMRPKHNPFGDGEASRRIVERMLSHIPSRERLVRHIA